MNDPFFFSFFRGLLFKPFASDAGLRQFFRAILFVLVLFPRFRPLFIFVEFQFLVLLVLQYFNRPHSALRSIRSAPQPQPFFFLSILFSEYNS